MNPIPPIQLPTEMVAAPPGFGNSPQTSNVFKDLMLQSIEHVNAMQQDADQAVEQLMTGGDANPAEVLTSIQKADMTFRMMMQIRNKLVQAYQEIKEIRI